MYRSLSGVSLWPWSVQQCQKWECWWYRFQVTCSSLPEVDFDQLVSAYKVLIPQYELLAAQYKSAELQAITHRCKSRFPSRAEWVPERRTVTEQERILLWGPSNAVIHRKKETVKDQHTGRVIEYNPMPESVSTVTTCSSFVRYKSKCEVPAIGCILILFEHSFGGQKYTLAVIRKYNPQRYTDCNLLYVEDHASTELPKIVVPISDFLHSCCMWYRTVDIWLNPYQWSDN